MVEKPIDTYQKKSMFLHYVFLMFICIFGIQRKRLIYNIEYYIIFQRSSKAQQTLPQATDADKA
jgi:hypothetical protein